MYIPRFQLYKSSYQLKLTHFDNPIIFQTPKVFISQIKPGSVQITLPIKTWSARVSLFYHVIDEIDNYIIRESGCTGKIYKILKKHFQLDKNRFAKKYRRSIYSIDYCIHLMYLHLARDYLVFDSNKNKLNCSLRKQTARMIIQLEYIWLRIENKELKSYGCHWKLEQIELIEDFPPLLKQCLFTEDNCCDKSTQTDFPIETKPKLKLPFKKPPFSIASLLQAKTKLGARPMISAAALLSAKSKIKKVDLTNKQKKNQKGFGISLQDIQGIRLKKTQVRKIIPQKKKTNNIPSFYDLRRKRILKRKVPPIIFSIEDLKSIKLKPIPKTEPKTRKLSFIEAALQKRFKNIATN